MKYILFLLIPIIAFAQVGNQKIRYQDLERTLERDVRRFSGDPTLTGLDSVGVYEHISSMKVYNVKDYGLTEIGLQSVINACNTSKGKIYITDNVVINDSVQIKDYTVLEGVGFNNKITIDTSGFSGTPFYLSGNAKRIMLKNLEIDMGGKDTGYIFDNPLFANYYSVDTLIFEDVRFYNGGAAIDLSRWSTKNIRLTRCTFQNDIYNSSSYPDTIPYSTSQVTVSRNRIDDTIIEDCKFLGYGLKVESDSNQTPIYLRNCYFRDIGFTATFFRTATDTLKNLYITNCTWDNVHKIDGVKGAIGFGTTSSTTNSYLMYSYIKDCNIYGCELGISLDGDQTQSYVENVEFSGLYLNGKPTMKDTVLGQYAIESGSGNSDNVFINDCHIENWLYQGIETSTCTNMIIDNVWIENCGILSTGYSDLVSFPYTYLCGINLGTSSDNVTIKNCTIKNIGVQAAIDSGYTVSGISFWASGNDSIRILNNLIYDTRSTPVMSYAIDMYESIATNTFHKQILIQRNTFENMSTRDINMRETSDGDADEVSTYFFTDNFTTLDTVAVDSAYNVRVGDNEKTLIKQSTGDSWDGVLSITGYTDANSGAQLTGLSVTADSSYRIYAVFKRNYVTLDAQDTRFYFHDGSSAILNLPITDTTGVYVLDTTVVATNTGSNAYFRIYRTIANYSFNFLLDTLLIIEDEVTDDTLTTDSFFDSSTGGFVTLNGAEVERLSSDNISLAFMPSAFKHMEYMFINPDTSWTLKLVPTSGDNFRGYSDNKMIEIENFGWVKCYKGTIWEILQSR